MTKNNKTKSHVRKMGEQRQQQAIQRYVGVGVVVVGIVLLYMVLGTSRWGMLLYVTGLVGAYYLYQDGQKLWQKAENAFRGDEAENEVVALLQVLVRPGWSLERNLRLPRWGDADIVLRSPRGNWYVIDVKSHAGTKVFEKGKLQKRYGYKTHNFREGDLIEKVKGQAFSVAKLKQVRWVTPLLCFTRGDVDIPGNQANGIYIVMSKDLVNTLVKQEG